MSEQAASQSTWTPPPGHLGNLTPDQQQILEQFRTQLSSDANFPWNAERHTDAYLLRFLRARKFVLEAAKLMIYKAEQWRKDFGVDDIVKNAATYDELKKHRISEKYPQYYHKTDKDGRPVYVESIGKLARNIKEMLPLADDILRVLVLEYERFLNERLPASSAILGHPVETSCTILDITGVGLGDFWRVKSYVEQASAIGQNYYPETMGKFYILNPPWGFSAVWAAVKPFLDPVTQEKIKVCSFDLTAIKSTSANSGVTNELLNQIPAENLPLEYGGRCACDGGCSNSNAGPWKHQPSETTSAEAPAPS